MANRNKSQESHWRGILKQQSSSGLSIAAFCHQNSITQTSYYAWQRKLREQKSSRNKQRRPTKSSQPIRNATKGAQLMPVRIEGTTPTSTLRIHLPQQGIFVDVPHGTDCETVKEVALNESVAPLQRIAAGRE